MNFLKYFLWVLSDFITKFIGISLSKIFRTLPNKIKKEIIYPQPLFKDQVYEAKLIRRKGYVKLNLKNNGNTFKTLEKLKLDTEKLLPTLFNSKIINTPQDKNFLKVYTKYLDSKDLYFIANDKYILQIVRSYFGFCPTIRTIDAWLNFPTGDVPTETQLFHRDADDHKLLKLFIPLCDVELCQGPFQYIEGSHHKKYLNEFFYMNKKNRIMSNKEKKLINNYSNIFTFISKFGEACIADTRGLHRGLKPTKDFRVMLVISFTSPNPNFPYVGLD